MICIQHCLHFLVFAMFKILPRWYILAGGGAELEDHKNLGIFRLGTGYETHLRNGWDITPIFAFYHKIDLNSFTLEILIVKTF